MTEKLTADEAVKFTPGPWVANCFLIVAPDAFGPNSGMYGGLEIAHTGMIGRNKPGEQAEADARLIAAAPELLAACVAMRKTMHSPDSAESKMADEAIAKATRAV